jgi:CheY-like chemotaxis protein
MLDGIDILLVEDNPYDVELTLRALRKCHPGERVQVVQDGAEALDFLFARGVYAGRKSAALPKVILLDLKLPKMSGLEVLRRVKSDSRTKNSPVVIFTSSHEDKDLRESYALGANSYLVKPVDFDKFDQLICQAANYWLCLNTRP